MRVQDLKDPGLAASVGRFQAHRERIETAFENARSGRIQDAEEGARLSKFAARERMHQRAEARAGVRAILAPPGLGQERVLGAGNDILSIEFLEAGLIASEAVGMLTVEGMDFGTGFLIGNGMVMTNHHVVATPDQAAGSELELDREDNRIGSAKPSETFDLDPGRFFMTDEALDFTIVAVAERSRAGRPLAQFGYHPLIAQEGKIRIGDPVNIIQHPSGGMKSVVLHDSRFLFLENGGELDPYCWYTSDTQPGSSGSPVFNNRWEVVALHHRSIPKTNDKGELVDLQGRPIPRVRGQDEPAAAVWIANEGIRASRLVKAIESAQIAPEYVPERNTLLDLWAQNKIRGQGAEAGRRDPSGSSAAPPKAPASGAESASVSASASASEPAPAAGPAPMSTKAAPDRTVALGAAALPGYPPVVVTIRIGGA